MTDLRTNWKDNAKEGDGEYDYIATKFLQDFQSDNTMLRVKALERLANLIATGSHTRFEHISTHPEIMACVLNVLSKDENSTIQCFAATVVNNMASGTHEQQKLLLKSGIVDCVTERLESAEAFVKDQLVLSLASLLCGCAGGDVIEAVQQSGGILSACLRELRHSSSPLTEHIYSLLVLLCKTSDRPLRFDNENLHVLIDHLESTNEEVVWQVCYLINYVCRNCVEPFSQLEYCDIVRKLVDVVIAYHKTRENIAFVALTALGTISDSSDDNACYVGHNLISQAPELLTSKSELIYCQTCALIANAAKSSNGMVDDIIANGVIKHMDHIASSKDYEIKKRVAFVIINIAHYAVDSHIKYLLDQNYLPIICSLLSAADLDILEGIMLTLRVVLEFGKRHQPASNYCAATIEKCGGIKQLEVLTGHSNPRIADVANMLLRKYLIAECNGKENFPDENYKL